MSNTYTCVELERFKNLYGGYDCNTWIVETVDTSNTNNAFNELNNLSSSETAELLSATLFLFAVAWTWKELALFVKQR